MRALLVVLLLAGTARADAFAELLGGIGVTPGYNLGAGPTLARRAGTRTGNVGIAVSAEVAYLSTDDLLGRSPISLVSAFDCCWTWSCTTRSPI